MPRSDVEHEEVTIVPLTEIPKATLENLVAEFILREGTDYGEHEMSFTEQAEKLHQQLRDGTVLVSFCHESETCNLIMATNCVY